MSVGRLIMWVLAMIPMSMAVDQCPTITVLEFCAAPVTGKCSGNTLSSEDVQCASGQLNSGFVSGTTVAACCTDIVSMCQGNKDPTTDEVCNGTTVNRGSMTQKILGCCGEPCSAHTCSTGFVADAAMASVAQPLAFPDSTCCTAVVADMCCGNSDASKDMTDATCGTGKHFKGTAAMRLLPKSESACCSNDITGQCYGNTKSSDDVSCPSGQVNTGGAGTNAAACCVDSCAGHSCPAGTHLDADPQYIQKGASPDTTCCSTDVTGKCGGNTAANEDVQCSATQMNLGSSITGTTAADCCTNRAMMCTNNAVASQNVDCAADCKIGSAGCAANSDSANMIYTSLTKCATCCEAKPSAQPSGGATASDGQKLQPQVMGLLLLAVAALSYWK